MSEVNIPSDPDMECKVVPKKEIEVLKKEKEELEVKLSEEKRNGEEKKKKLEDLEKEKCELLEKLELARKELEEKEDTLKNGCELVMVQDEEVSRLGQELGRREKKIEKIRKERNEAQRIVQDREQKLKDLESTVESLKKKMEEESTAQAKVLEELQLKLKLEQEEKDRTKMALVKSEELVKDLKYEAESQRKETLRFKTEAEQVQKSFDTLDKDYAALERHAQQVTKGQEDKIRDLEEKVKSLEARLERKHAEPALQLKISTPTKSKPVGIAKASTTSPTFPNTTPICTPSTSAAVAAVIRPTFPSVSQNLGVSALSIVEASSCSNESVSMQSSKILVTSSTIASDKPTEEVQLSISETMNDEQQPENTDEMWQTMEEDNHETSVNQHEIPDQNETEQSFSSYNSNSDHINYHPTHFVCPELGCNKTFLKGKLMREHRIQEHKQKVPGKFGCRRCCNFFKTIKARTKHQRTEHGIKPGPWPILIPVQDSLGEPTDFQTAATSFEAGSGTGTIQSCEDNNENSALSHPELIPSIRYSLRRKASIRAVTTSSQRKRSKKDAEHGIDESKASHGYFCLCGSISPNKPALEKHINYFAPQFRFQCEHCSRNYSATSFLRVHMQRIHNLSYPYYGCRFCGKTFPSKTALCGHRKSKMCSKGPSAKKTFISLGSRSSNFSVNKSFPSVTPKNLFKFPCNICQKRFKTHTELNTHLTRVHRSHPRSKGFSGCTLCGRLFPNLSLLYQHRKLAHGNAPSINIQRKRKLTHLRKEPLDSEPSSSKSNAAATNLTLVKERPLSEDQQQSLQQLKHKRDHSKVHRDKIFCTCGTEFCEMAKFKKHIKYHKLPNKFKCLQCPMKFKMASIVKVHMKNKHQGYDYQLTGCTICGGIFNSQDELQTHKSKNHRNRKGTVNVSDVDLTLNPSSPSPATLLSPENTEEAQDHLMPLANATVEVSGAALNNCTNTPIVSSCATAIQFIEFDTHALDRSKEKAFFCICGLEFGSKNNLYAHVQYFALGKKFPCELCKNTFTSVNYLNCHKRIVHKVRMPPKPVRLGCRTCGVIFASRKEFSQHRIKVFTPAMKLADSFCPGKLLGLRDDNVVVTAQESETNQSFRASQVTPSTSCSASHQVPSTSSNHNTVKRQMKPFTVEPKFECKTCGVKFLVASTICKHLLRKHKIVQTGVGCKDCGELFPTNFELESHYRIVHNHGVPFEMELKYDPTTPAPSVCSQDMSQELLGVIENDNVDTQKQTVRQTKAHTAVADDPQGGLNKYKCTCGKVFRSKVSRNVHIRAKTRGKIFICSWCPGGTVRFDLNPNLNQHMRTVHPGVSFEKYACGTCAKTFPTLDDVRQHRKTEHANLSVGSVSSIRRQSESNEGSQQGVEDIDVDSQRGVEEIDVNDIF